MQELKQSTEIKVRIGPFVDVGDGVTPETGITLGAADEAELLKHDGAATVSIAASTWVAITDCDGWYDLTLTTTDTNTLGHLTVVVQDASVCLPVVGHFMVLSANFWDSKFGAGYIDVDVASIADAVWDEILTGLTHNIQNSAGKRLRQIAAYNIHDGTAQDGAGHTITLAAGASSTDQIYNRNLIVIIGGTGEGQTRTIADYVGTTKVAAVDRDWEVIPNATSEYQILADDVPVVSDHGIAQTATSTTITIRSGGSSIDDTHTGNVVGIFTNAAAGQSRLITAYDGATKVATITPAWITIPDSTSVYGIFPYGCSCVGNICCDALDQIGDAVWDEDLSTHTTAGTAGKIVSTIKTIVNTVQALVLSKL